MLNMLRRGWTGLKGSLQKQAVNRSRLKKYGLGWMNRKLLKHQSDATVKHHSLDGITVYYKNGSELLHTIEELFVKELYKADLPDTPYIIDGGANIGLSILYFIRTYPQAIVEAFEPDEQNFDLLRQNTERLGTQVKLHKAALWNENGTVHFDASGNMGAKITAGSDSIRQVPSKRLKDLIHQKVDLLKLDIEGAEYEVILDIADTLSFVDRLFLEYHGSFEDTYKLSELLTILQKAGFKCYIKEAAENHMHPFDRRKSPAQPYDLQLNMFFFR